MHPQTKIAISGIQNRMRDTSVEMNDQPALKRMLYDLARAISETNVDSDNARVVLSDLADCVSALSERMIALEQNAEAAVAVPLPPVRWEYFLHNVKSASEATAIEGIGNLGWELVQFAPAWAGAADVGRYIFKRPRAPE